MQASQFSMKALSSLDIKRYLLLCLSYKWRILAISCLITLLAIFVVMQKVHTYASTATLLIEAGQSKSGSAADAYTANSGRREFYKTQFEILKSKVIAETVIENLNLLNHAAFFGDGETENNSFLADLWANSSNDSKQSNSEQENNKQLKQKIKMARMLKIFQLSMNISPIWGTQLVNISFVSTEPQLAADIANGIGQAYIDNEVAARIETIKQASNWLSSKLVDLSLSLELSELALQKFRERENIVDINSAVVLIDQELAAATERLTLAQNDHRKNNAILSVINASGEKDKINLASLPEITSHSSVQASQVRLLTAQLEFDDLSKIYGNKHPKLISSKNEVAVLSNQVEQQIQKLIRSIEIEALRANESVIRYQKNLQIIRNKYQLITKVEHEYLRLKRNVDTNRSLFESFFARSKETAIASDFNFSPARFTGKATAALYPVKTKKKLIVIAAFVLTMGFCLALVLLFEILNDTVKSTKDVENVLTLRMLGIVPLVDTGKEKKLALHLFYDENARKFAESIRTLRSNFMLAMLNKENQIFEVTSSIPGEGKTTVAINLAFSLAKMGKIILIDADLRKPSLGHRFEIPPYHPGLSNLLAGTEKLEDCISIDEKSGITVIPCGQIPKDPLELLSLDNFSKLLYILKRSYTHIIIDTPPIYVANDSLVIAQHVDNVIYVVKADDTRMAVVQSGIKRLIEVNAKIAGVILNQVDLDATSHQAEDYSGYYDYYSYGKNDSENEGASGLGKGKITLLS